MQLTKMDWGFESMHSVISCLYWQGPSRILFSLIPYRMDLFPDQIIRVLFILRFPSFPHLVFDHTLLFRRLSCQLT